MKLPLYDANADPDDMIMSAMEFVRAHLDMELAYLTEVEGDTVHFRKVVDPMQIDLLRSGDQRKLQELFCTHVVAERIPSLLPDIRDYPLAADAPITAELGIGAHLTLPIRRSDGSVYGTFCAMSRNTRRDLGARDLGVASMFADLTARFLNDQLDRKAERDRTIRTITRIMDDKAFTIHWQPIFDLDDRRIAGYEALSRFFGDPYRAPDTWFSSAGTVGLQTKLELAAIEAALDDLHLLRPGAYAAVNASPDTIRSAEFMDLLGKIDGRQIIVELTEHAELGNMRTLTAALDRIRARGVMLAIDDLGAGYSGLSTVVALTPDVLKLDRSLVHKVHTDSAKQALTQAMVRFADQIGAVLVAEGIERAEECAALQQLGITRGQGFLLARPSGVFEPLERKTG